MSICWVDEDGVFHPLLSILLSPLWIPALAILWAITMVVGFLAVLSGEDIMEGHHCEDYGINKLTIKRDN